MKLNLSSLLTIATLALGGILGASALSALAQSGSNWTAPTEAPPFGNVDAPLNVGPIEQAKTGLLGLRSFLFNPTATDDSVTPGHVLTAIDSDGTVGWVPSAGASNIIQKGVVNIPMAAYSQGQTAVTFSQPLPTIPVVTIQPQWARYSGDENIAWWVTEVTTSGFKINYHTPGSGTNYGEGKVMWLAVADPSALSAGTLSCTKSSNTYSFSGAPSGGIGSYTYKLYFTNKPHAIPVNVDVTVPGSYTYNTAWSGYQTVYLKVTSGANQLNVSCPAS